MYTSYGWELTNLLQGQDEEYLLEVLTENYRRLRDVPDHLIVTLLEYRGYTGRGFVYYGISGTERFVVSNTGEKIFLASGHWT